MIPKHTALHSIHDINIITYIRTEKNERQVYETVAIIHQVCIVNLTFNGPKHRSGAL